MALFNLFKKRKDFFTLPEQEKIVEAIRLAEKETSGEIRLFVESKNAFVNPIDRAAEIFATLKMQETDDRNAVLIYIAMVDHELALFGDEGIYKRVGQAYWDEAVKQMTSKFSADNVAEGLIQCVQQIGQTLKETFPYNAATDKNELPDDIVFGK